MTPLLWEGVRLPDIPATIGTPALLASERRLRENIRDLRRGFESVWPSTMLRYCAKANPDLHILRIACEEGVHVLASHLAEVQMAIAAGFAPDQIAWQRPVIDERELAAVTSAGVRRVHAFRLSDLDALSQFSATRGVEFRVSLRIAIGRPGMRLLSAASNRLGVNAAIVRKGVARREGITIDALNTYIGTQQEHPQSFRPAARTLARLAVALGEHHPIDEINLGGGIPSNSIRRLTPARLLSRGGGAIAAASPAPYAAALAGIAAEEFRRADPSFHPRLVLEPGRSIVGNAVVLLTRVAAEQDRWRFLDCGRNVLVESPLAFTRWIAPLVANGSHRTTVHLSGPTLNTLDVVDLHRHLPALHAGDVVAIGDAGAYTLSRGSRYAGLAPALWLAQLDGRLTCIRRGETFEDFTAPMLGASD